MHPSHAFFIFLNFILKSHLGPVGLSIVLVNHEAWLYEPLCPVYKGSLCIEFLMWKWLNHKTICSIEHACIQLLHDRVFFETPCHNAHNNWEISSDFHSQQPLIATKFLLLFGGHCYTWGSSCVSALRILYIPHRLLVILRYLKISSRYDENLSSCFFR